MNGSRALLSGMAQIKRGPLPAIRKTAMKSNAFIGNAERIIEREMKLPKGSVRLVLPNGRVARTDKILRNFLKDWEVV